MVLSSTPLEGPRDITPCAAIDWSKTYNKVPLRGTTTSCRPTLTPTLCRNIHRSMINRYAFTIALSPIWMAWISSLHLNCRVELNREHVIPRSKLPKYVTERPHNIIGFPTILNSKRGTLKYVDSKKPGMPIWPCKNCRSSTCKLMGKINKEGFTPPAIYKPVIGASVLRSMYTYPELTQFIHEEVLDMGLAMTWVNSSFEALPSPIKSVFSCY